MLSRLVITSHPRSKRLLISWLQSPSSVILEPRKIKSLTVSTVSPSICHEVMGLLFSILFNFFFLWDLCCYIHSFFPLHHYFHFSSTCDYSPHKNTLSYSTFK